MGGVLGLKLNPHTLTFTDVMVLVTGY